MRSYGQYCAVARALDVVGDRWSMLIVRELLQLGPCRFTDLKRGLPGIAPNLLSSRLRDLEDDGLIMRSDPVPPNVTARYDLTTDGRELEPALRALGLWGLRFMARVEPDDAFTPHWLAHAAAWFAVDADPDGPPAVIQVIASGEHAVLELSKGEIKAQVGDARRPNLTVEGGRNAVLGLLTGRLETTHAIKLGVTLRGQRRLLKRLAPAAPLS